jgi:S1-C subfamily serine protease
MKLLPIVFAAVPTLFVGSTFADEGMWTFDNFPSAAVREKYGVVIDQAWLERVQRAAVRLSSGCSASIVTADGLLLTNNHCVRDCAQALSSAERDYNALAADLQSQ